VVAYRGNRQVGARSFRAADGDFAGTVKTKRTPTRLVASVAADSATGATRIAVKLPASQP
jgi:hypothetical protein